MYCIGYDIGGTKCAVSLGDACEGSMEVLAKRQFPTQGAPMEVLARMADAAEQLLSERKMNFSDIASAGIRTASAPRSFSLSAPAFGPRCRTTPTPAPWPNGNSVRGAGRKIWPFSPSALDLARGLS